jgi:hypothetical protein
MAEETGDALTGRLRTAGALIAAGLVVEAGSLYWAHPTAFLVFAGLGGTAIAAGVVLYLLAVASR